MRYINKLQDDVKTVKAERDALKVKVADLVKYLTSSKFHCGDDLDGYVNTQDVLNRLS